MNVLLEEFIIDLARVLLDEGKPPVRVTSLCDSMRTLYSTLQEEKGLNDHQALAQVYDIINGALGDLTVGKLRQVQNGQHRA